MAAQPRHMLRHRPVTLRARRNSTPASFANRGVSQGSINEARSRRHQALEDYITQVAAHRRSYMRHTFEDLLGALPHEEDGDQMHQLDVQSSRAVRPRLVNFADEHTVYFVGDGSEGMCTICLELTQNGQPLRRLQCLHVFHASCIDRWCVQRPTCPLCQSRVRGRSVNSAGHGSVSAVAAAPVLRHARERRQWVGAVLEQAAAERPSELS
mmetsp:Transcript_121082/g.197007  ORF Transcript_121082/g.197007 Transcript_121082/m.197007 type:complete len:211 (-) Transcript_121082:12-644(-)